MKAAKAASLFAALGDETRLALVLRLARGGPQSITRLSEGAAVSRQAVTKHLRTLRSAGFARCRRSGREQVWELTPGRLEQAHTYLNEISAEWDAAIERLRRFVENQ